LAKIDLLGPEAERLYVIEQCSLAEIASRLGVAERSIRNWKERGGWDEKRRGYLASRKGFHEELYEFARELLASVRRDMSEGKEVAASRLYALLRLLPNLVRVQDYERVAAKAKPDSKDGFTPEELAKLINEQLCGHG
jgi:hypothetical protein